MAPAVTSPAADRAGRRKRIGRSISAARSSGRAEASALAYRRLRDSIVAGRLPPGAPLVESEISGRLGVSRTPVRAALQRLQQEGFVTASRAGTMLRARVTPLTAGDMREVFFMLSALDATAARLAAALAPGARAALAATLEGIGARLHAAWALSPPDVARAHALHLRFHRACGEAAAGPRLRAELDVLRPQAERYLRAYEGSGTSVSSRVAGDHAAIVEAVRSGDRDGAERAVALDWRASADRCGQAATLLGERGNW